jgi:quercetin dioxygenase-like cupin family protein
MLIVENGVANLRTYAANYYVPSGHYIWIPLNVEHAVEFTSEGVIIKTIYFNNEEVQHISSMDVPAFIP